MAELEMRMKQKQKKKEKPDMRKSQKSLKVGWYLTIDVCGVVAAITKGSPVLSQISTPLTLSVSPAPPSLSLSPQDINEVCLKVVFAACN